MNTDDLIDDLANGLAPTRRWTRLRRLATGLLVGGIVTLATVVLGLGIRPDLGAAMHGASFWMKWGYTISLGVGAVAIAARLGRPETMRLSRFWPLAIPVVALAAIGAIEMGRVPPGEWLAMWLGQTWKICSWLVLVLSLPIFIGLLWSFRRLAPTQLRATGAAAGLAAGAWAAAAYCVHCPEASAIFVLTWYTLGIALAAGLGALIGPRALRW